MSRKGKRTTKKKDSSGNGDNNNSNKNNINENNSGSPSTASMTTAATRENQNDSISESLLNNTIPFSQLTSLDRSRGARTTPRTPVQTATTMDRLKQDLPNMGPQEIDTMIKLLEESRGAVGGIDPKKKLNFPNLSEAGQNRDRSQSRKRRNGGGGEDPEGKRQKQMSNNNAGYNVEKVFLSGISELIRKNGISFKKGILKAIE